MYTIGYGTLNCLVPVTAGNAYMQVPAVDRPALSVVPISTRLRGCRGWAKGCHSCSTWWIYGVLDQASPLNPRVLIGLRVLALLGGTEYVLTGW